MRKMIAVTSFLLFALAFGAPVLAQGEPKLPQTSKAVEAPAHYYHLEFVVQEMGTDNKPANSRTYTTTVSTDDAEFASIRTNSRLPIVTSSTTTPDNPKDVNTAFQYFDVGVNIDAHHAREINRQLSLDLNVEISSLAARDPDLHQPIIRQNKWKAVVLIPIGKRTVVFTSDALDSKGSMQLVVTATPLQ